MAYVESEVFVRPDSSMPSSSMSQPMTSMALSESKVIDLALTPFRAAISKPARRAYISSLLFVSTSLVLLGLSTLAYLLFYWNYIPPLGFSHPLYLQFPSPAPTSHPHALLSLPPSSLIPNQPYDIHLTLSLPRSPPNLHAGNFMLDLSLLSPPLSSTTPPTTLHTSRRPALLTYTSPLLTRLSLFAFSPLYLLGFLQERETLDLPMFEGVEFARGWKNLPRSLRLELHAPSAYHPTSDNKKLNMEVYAATVHFRARLRGLRWLMYNHRILSLLVFVTAFYCTSLVSTALAWVLLSIYLPSRTATDRKVKIEPGETEDSARVKNEEDEEETDVTVGDEADLSDTPRTFPPYSSRFAPLRYPPAVGGQRVDPGEEAEGEEEGPSGGMFGIVGLERRREGRGGADSGLGTSLSESITGRGGQVEGLQRRGSGGRR